MPRQSGGETSPERRWRVLEHLNFRSLTVTPTRRALLHGLPFLIYIIDTPTCPSSSVSTLLQVTFCKQLELTVRQAITAMSTSPTTR